MYTHTHTYTEGLELGLQSGLGARVKVGDSFRNGRG